MKTVKEVVHRALYEVGVGYADEYDVGVIISALNAAGYVIVPKEATKEMIEAAFWAAADEDAERVWQRMLAARPK